MANYSTYSDSQLTELLRGSDHAAFTEILKRYSALLINFAYRKLADLPLAEDFVHDVWTDLWSKRGQYNYIYGFEAFIFSALRNRILQHYRRGKIVHRYFEYFKMIASKTEESSDFLIRHNELATLIEQEIAALPHKMRTVFELSRKTNMSRKEIAKHLNVLEGNVKINMERALNILKGRLACPLMGFWLSQL